MAKVTITFDNGPEPPVTHHVLDVLGRVGVKSSFFVIGRKMESAEGRAAVARARDEGHWIGNHSYSRSTSLGDSDDPSVFDAEVTRGHEIIGALAHPDKLFRPYCNSGVMDGRVFKRGHIARLAAEGYTCVMFNALTGDWHMDGLPTALAGSRAPWRRSTPGPGPPWDILRRHRLAARWRPRHRAGFDSACVPMRLGKITQSIIWARFELSESV